MPSSDKKTPLSIVTPVIVFMVFTIGNIMGQNPFAERFPETPPERAVLVTEGDDVFTRTSRVYDMGRNTKDYYESRRLLSNAETGFKYFLDNYPNHKERQTAHYRMAVSQLLIGKLDTAEKNFDRIIKKYKTGQLVAASAYRMGAQQHNSNSYERAEYYFNIAARESEKDSLRHQALYQQVRCLMINGQNEAAIAPLNRLINAPENSYQDTARLTLGKIQYNLKNYDGALTAFKQLADTPLIDKDVYSEANLYIGLCYAKSGNTADSLLHIEQTLQDPRIKKDLKAIAQNELIKICYANEEYVKVIRQYDTGIFSGEKMITASSYLLSGYSFLKKNDLYKAMASFGSVEDTLPNTYLAFEAAYRKLYCAYQADSSSVSYQADNFLKTYQSFLTEHEWRPLALTYKAESLNHNSQPEKAAKVYSKINSDVLPENLQAEFLIKKISCFDEIGDLDKAIKSADAFLGKFIDHPANPEIAARRGNSYLAKKNFSAATKDFQHVSDKTSDPDLRKVALLRLIDCQRELREYPKIISTCQTLLEKYPDLPDNIRAKTLYWKGWGYFKQEDFSNAVPPLQEARKLLPKLYNEPAGSRIVLSGYYLQDPELMYDAYIRVKRDYPGKYFPPRILAWLGIQYYQREEFAAANRIFKEIVTVHSPDDTPLDVWRFLSKSNLNLGRFSDAIKSADLVIAKEEDPFWKADALLDKAQAQLGFNQINEAISTAQEGLSYNPIGGVNANLHFVIAECHYRNKKLDLALQEYNTVSSKFEGDNKLHPYCLWKIIGLLEEKGSADSTSVKHLLAERYPDWQAQN